MTNLPVVRPLPEHDAPLEELLPAIVAALSPESRAALNNERVHIADRDNRLAHGIRPEEAEETTIAPDGDPSTRGHVTCEVRCKGGGALPGPGRLLTPTPGPLILPDNFTRA